jgi:hypothetical protein
MVAILRESDRGKVAEVARKHKISGSASDLYLTAEVRCARACGRQTPARRGS